MVLVGVMYVLDHGSGICFRSPSLPRTALWRRVLVVNCDLSLVGTPSLGGRISDSIRRSCQAPYFRLSLPSYLSVDKRSSHFSDVIPCG